MYAVVFFAGRQRLAFKTNPYRIDFIGLCQSIKRRIKNKQVQKRNVPYQNTGNNEFNIFIMSFFKNTALKTAKENINSRKSGCRKAPN